MKINVFVALSVVGLSACQSNQAINATHFALPRLTPETSAQYLDLSAKDKGAKISDYWVVDARADPTFPTYAALKGLSGCANLLVAINEKGEAAGYKLLNAYPEGVFAQSAVEAISRWHWKAVEGNREHQPVLTTIKLDFMLSNSSNVPSYEKYCESVHTMPEYRQPFK